MEKLVPVILSSGCRTESSQNCITIFLQARPAKYDRAALNCAKVAAKKSAASRMPSEMVCMVQVSIVKASLSIVTASNIDREEEK